MKREGLISKLETMTMKHEEYFNNLKLAQGKAAEEAQEEEMRQKRLLDE